MATAVTMSVFLVLVTCLFHFTILCWLAGGMSRIVMSAGTRMMVIVLVALGAHILEIIFYAGAYALGDGVLGLGSFGGIAVVHYFDYLYFSSVTYTSLGLGDVFPGGHLRFITGVEALNGLLLIAWSGSFLYLAMGRLWPWQSCAETRPTNAGPRD